MRPICAGKHARQLIKMAEALGFRAQLTRKSHLRFTKPGCTPVFTSGTPSDRRSLQNAMAHLRKSDEGTM